MALEIFRLVGSVFVDTDKADKSLKKTDKNASNLGKTLVDGVKAVGKFAAGVAATAAAAGAALAGIAESTREYRTEQGKLTAAFEVQNFSADQARKTYEALNGVLGDSGQAVEAANHLAQLADTEKELNTWTQICTGVYATFGDSLPIEGLTEAANETAKTGSLTGALADSLNWAGVSETEFQASLDACATEQERQALITETLNGLYSEASDKYQELNADVIAANEAQDKLNQTMANIGAAIEPFITKGKELLASVLERAAPHLEQLASTLLPWLSEAISKLSGWIDVAIGAVQGIIEWFREMGAYAAETLQPIIDDLAGAFDWVKQKLEPLTSALEEYFTSGEAAEDITNIVKDAINFLADAYEVLKGFIADVAAGFQDANVWAKEHENLLIAVSIAAGTLATAIGAYNAVQAIANAGGIVAIARNIAYEVSFWALVAAETAHTIATTVATAATAAFGAAVAFLTSPVTLVVAAIGALIAIVVLLVKNWDSVKEAASKCWDWIKGVWSGVGNWMNTNVIQPVARFFSGLWDGIKNTFSNVTTWFKDTFSKAWTAVKNVFSAGGKIFDGIKDGIANVFKTVVNGIIRGINKVISVPFNAINNMLSRIRSVEILKIKPFSWISTFSVPQIPELEEGAVLEKGQVGLLEGKGAEAVVPLHQNQKWVSAVARDMSAAMGNSDNGQIVALLRDILDVLETIAGADAGLDRSALLRVLVDLLAKPMDKKLGQLQAAKARA